jgi:hypothetical protein
MESKRTPNARVTLNLPPELYREVKQWCVDASEALGRPNVSVQDAMRAMVRASCTNPAAVKAAISQLRKGDGARR